MKRTPATLLLILAFVIAVAVLFGSSIAWFLTDLMWFRSIGYDQVFWGVIRFRVGIGALCGLIWAALMFANLYWAGRQSTARRLVLPPEIAEGPIGGFLERATLIRFALVFSILVGLIAGYRASAWWPEFMLFFNAEDFQYADPIHGRDARFYVFTLPVLYRIRAMLTGLVLVSAASAIGVYLVRGAMTFRLVLMQGQYVPKGVNIGAGARVHLAGLAAALVALGALGSYLGRYDIFTIQRELFSGPGYSDKFGTLPLLAIQSLSLLAAAVMLFVGLGRWKLRWIASGAAVALISIALTAFYPRLVQRFSVEPNEFNRERPYIENHIRATRFAFGLSAVESRRLSGEARLEAADIEANRATINNIRLWDYEPLLANFRKRQELRQYYYFGSVDNDRYRIGGELRQLMLSPRELPVTGLERRTWINDTIIYTHGYGLALSPVNQIDPDGQPVLFVRNLPPQVEFPELRIDRPQIYFGEFMSNSVFVKTDIPEFDYPSGDEDQTTTYTGTGGVQLDSALTRLLFSIRLASVKILLAQDFTSETRVFLYRDIRRRVARVAPFLTLDRDPYLVITEGRLVWMFDAYTRTDRFPYAVHVPGVGSYIRNSVKITLDAYDGAMDFYLIDPTDPIAKAWAATFPDLFKPMGRMPPSIREHIRYPEDLFTVQTNLYATYHMQDPEVFYKQGDKWEIPTVTTRPMAPYYTVMKLPGEEREEFILMLPFTPKNRPNLAAWMVARSDGDDYGGLIVYTVPKDTSLYGPKIVVDRINQDVDISRQVSLWNQQGSEVVWGTLLVIPIEESLIYVQALYLRAEGGGIPEMKRVIVGYENKIVMESSLEGALAKIFVGLKSGAPTSVTELPSLTEPPGAEPPAAPSDLRGQWSELARRARRHYEAATEAARRGDWAGYGEEIERLGELLERMQREAPSSDSPDAVQ